MSIFLNFLNCSSFFANHNHYPRETQRKKKLECTTTVLANICTNTITKMHFAQDINQCACFFVIDWANFDIYTILHSMM